jgi:homogentisate phytyltransferase/homogentisate geranylgeranyltransferase
MRDKLAEIVQRLENAPGHGLLWILLFFAVTFLRGFLEGIFEESQTLGFRLETLPSLEMMFLHGPLFYLLTFSFGALILSVLAKSTVDRTLRVVIIFSPVILVAPLLDAVLGPQGFRLYYFQDAAAALRAVVYTFCPVKVLEGVSPGMRVEVLLACLGGAIYLWVKRSRLLFFVMGFVTIYLVALFGGFVPALYTWIVQGHTEEARIFKEGGLILTDSRKYALVHLELATLLLFWGYLRFKRGRIRKLMTSIRPLRSLLYLFATGFGLLLGAIFLRDYYPEYQADPFMIPAVAGSLLAIFFIFQSQLLVNDYFDRDIDRVSAKRTFFALGTVEACEALTIGSVMLTLSLAYAAAIGYAALLLCVAAHLVGIIYSAPPVRLKRFFLLNTGCIACCIMLAVYLGFSLFAGRHAMAAFPGGVALFVFGVFTFASAVKDLPDAEGDRLGGVRTFATLFGVRASRYALSVIVVAAYLAAPLLLGRPILLAASLPCGVLSAVALLKERERWVFVLLFLAVTLLGILAWRGYVLAPASLSPRSEMMGRYLKGVELIASGNSAAGVEQFDAVINGRPPGSEHLLPDMLVRAGKAKLRAGRAEEGYRSLASAWQAAPYREEAAVYAAAAQLEMGRSGKAAAFLTDAIAVRPQSARLRLARGRVLLDRDQQQAARDLEFAYHCRLERAVTCSYLGDLSRRAARAQEAVFFYEEALGVDPDFIPAWAGLAETHLQAGNDTAAKACMAKTRDLLAEAGRLQEARRWSERIESQGPRSGPHE